MQLFEDVIDDTPGHSTIRLVNADAMNALGKLGGESVHLCVTDPPYFLDGLDSKWRKGSQKKEGVIGSLPVGMRFDPKQGKNLQCFMQAISEKLINVLVPGAFALFFSQPRLAGRMSVGIEDAGFEIRDQLAWRFTKKSQFKAFTMDHFIDKIKYNDVEKREIKLSMKNRRTPQLRPQFESIILAQKPKDGTHIDNWLEHETGLIDSSQLLDGNLPSTVLTVEKPDKEDFNKHLTVKPLKLIEYLIRLFSREGQSVIDPFLGSGTTAVACHHTKRSCIGIEINPDYIRLAEQRLRHHFCGYYESP